MKIVEFEDETNTAESMIKNLASQTLRTIQKSQPFPLIGPNLLR